MSHVSQTDAFILQVLNIVGWCILIFIGDVKLYELGQGSLSRCICIVGRFLYTVLLIKD